MGLVIKLVIGLLLIPVAIGATTALYSHMLLVQELSTHMRLFLWGIACYVILHIFFYKPTYFYILGHEAVHAVTSWLFGGRVKSIKVSQEGGSVATDKSNFVIELAPYFIPLYAVIILCVYFVVSASYKINSSTFIFLIGFTLSFHIVSTAEMLKLKQPDIVRSGYVFSMVVIYLLNIVMVSLVFGAIFSGFDLTAYFEDLFTSSKDVYLTILKQLFQ